MEESAVDIRSRLRREALVRRDELPVNMRDAYSQLIRTRVMKYLEQHVIRNVHIYLSIRSEVQTRGIIEDLFERGIEVIVPLTEKNNVKMLHSVYHNGDKLQAGKFGVPEPCNPKLVPEDRIDAVILPIVAFDGNGVRLGYGKGYYDRFLSHLEPKVLRLGLAFSLQEVDNIPTQSHDQLMYSVFTEQTQFFFN